VTGSRVEACDLSVISPTVHPVVMPPSSDKAERCVCAGMPGMRGGPMPPGAGAGGPMMGAYSPGNALPPTQMPARPPPHMMPPSYGARY